MTVATGVQRLAVAQGTGRRLPDAASLQAGDFLWPKKPGAFIPYRLDTGQDVDADREDWLKEKQQFIAKARASGNPELTAAANRIAPLTYNDFRSLYLRNQDPGAITPYSLGAIAAVGHVAIVQVDQAGQPWVIEALWKPGVTRSTYSAWLAGRSGEIVWQGRLNGVAQSDRAKIAAEAVRWVSKPYDFWNFDLADSSGFYCSKLVWFCVMSALHTPIDGDPNPKRAIWLSPKQVLYSKSIDRLVDPGEYGSE
jgi:hypothetical protein